MSYLDHLKESLKIEEELAPPQNLGQLSRRLKVQAHTDTQLAKICLEFALRCAETRRANADDLQDSRGKLQQLWQVQDEIYQDLVEHLEQAARYLTGPIQGLPRLSQSFEALLLDLRESIQAMDKWRTARSLRCLACGWSDGSTDVCPHCDITVLQPVRQTRGQEKIYAELSGRQFELFSGVSEVLAGAADLDSLWEPLDELQGHYQQCLEELAGAQPTEDLKPLTETLTLAIAGLDTMARTFDDLDAQHLEDGWHTFFVAERHLAEMLPGFTKPGTGQDEILLSQE